MIYLACPYSHHDEKVKEARYRAVKAATAHFLKQGLLIFSPIVHNHVIATEHEFPDSFMFWRKLDLDMVSRCEQLWVLQLDGWDTSVGVSHEVQHALIERKPVKYVRHADYSVRPL